MGATKDSGFGHGTNGSPQKRLNEQYYITQQEEIETTFEKIRINPTYVPSVKHEKGYGWGSENPIKSQEEGQSLLDNGYTDGKHIYNITKEGKIVKFQPDGTAENGYHPYEVNKPRDIPPKILKELLNDGKITKAEYNRLRKGKI